MSVACSPPGVAAVPPRPLHIRTEYTGAHSPGWPAGIIPAGRVAPARGAAARVLRAPRNAGAAGASEQTALRTLAPARGGGKSRPRPRGGRRFASPERFRFFKAETLYMLETFMPEKSNFQVVGSSTAFRPGKVEPDFSTPPVQV